MSWRDRLREASFRGVRFHVLSGDVQFGRRTVLHEFPLRDKPFVEDMGRRARLVNVEAVILGPDYMTGRDALIAAAEQPGGGKLVHPTHGELQVTLTEPLRISETTAEGGICRIAMTFVEAGEVLYPSASIDTGTQLTTAADKASSTLGESFADRFDLDDLPAFARSSALATLTSALDRVQGVVQRIRGLSGGRAVFDALLGDLRSQTASLFHAPATLALRVIALVGQARTLAGSGSAGQRAMLAIAGVGGTLPTIPLITPTRRRQADNQAALVELVDAVVSIEAARACAVTPFVSYEQAIAARDLVLASIDAVRDASPSDALYAALTDLRVTLVRDVAARGADLARQGVYTPAATLPALVLSYALYGDVAHEADLVARNAIAHPGFVPGGLPLTVLADG